MANNTIHIVFDECDLIPANGYRVLYRPAGSLIDFREWPTSFPGSPAVFVDTLDPLGTQYEGLIMGDCGDGKYGVPIDWMTEGSGFVPGSSGAESGSVAPPVPCRTYTLSQTVGTPSAHYTDCAGVTHDTAVTSMTVICTNGHGFTISGGGIVVNSFVDGDCGGVCHEGCGQYQAIAEDPFGVEGFTWVDCQGGVGVATVEWTVPFFFCTCDANPQYSTDNVTVSRVGDCP